ncbi:MAG: RluA family pseudouridine synthase [Deltaproteobacteria bacterium]|nr:RluA family pseudouridine synthase [Deltaproteobacteria bacterium]
MAPGAARKRVLAVAAVHDGVELGALLVERLGLSAEAARRLVAQGGAYVDGRRERAPTRRLRAGEKITVYEAPRVEEGPASNPLPGTHPAAFEVAYVDEHLAVVVKPAGMPSEPDRAGSSPSLAELVRGPFGEQARLMHRLDRAASGLLLVARSLSARRVLAREVAEHRLGRRYFALVGSAPEAPFAVLRSRLQTRAGRTTESQRPEAAMAETHVRYLRAGVAAHLLEVELRTGRTHQIRAQLAAQGLPLLGDDRYDGPLAPRLGLHAHVLVLPHPEGPRLELHAPLPAALRALL